MTILIQMAIGAILIILTVIIHAYILDLLFKKGEKVEFFIRKLSKSNWKCLFITFVILIVFLSIIIQMWLWAFTYYFLVDEIATMESALYFSISTYTTVGYGDIVLSESWRILSTIESVNGFLLFGWSTAFIFEVILQIYKREAKTLVK